MLSEVLPHIIRDMRKNKGLTQSELADRCNVTQQAVGLWEKGKTFPDLASILKLSQIFQTTTDYLLTGQLSLAGKKTGPVSPEEAYVIEQYRLLAPEGRNAINSMLKALVQASALPDTGGPHKALDIDAENLNAVNM